PIDKILPRQVALSFSLDFFLFVKQFDLPSCAGRCGEGYSRDATCNCDYNCQHYMECCPDFKKVCTMELSCKGRCFESFARGRECDCDSECKKYGKCCPDYENFCGRVHNPPTPPSSKTAPPPPGAPQTIKSTTKRSPKAPNKKKTKKVIESEEITEEHSVSENQESSSSSSSSSSTIRKIKSSKNSAANKELKKKPKVTDNKKEKTPKKKPTPEQPVVDEAGSGLDNGDIKLTPTPDTPTTERNKVTTPPKITTGKPINPKPSLPPDSDTSKGTPSTPNKETTVETKETSLTNKETSSGTKEKTISTKETRSAEKTPAKDSVPTSKAPEPTPTTPKEPAATTPKEPAEPEPTTPKEPIPTISKEPEPTISKEPEPTTPKEPEPTTPKEPEPTTSKEPAPTTPKKPAPTTTKEPAPTAPKKLAPTAPKEPTPKLPKKPAPASLETPAPTTSEVTTTTTTMEPPTTPKNPAESTPEFPAEPTPEALENSPKETSVSNTKAPEVTEPEMTTTAKDKTEKDIHRIPETEETTAPKTSTATQVTSITSSKITPKATTLAPKVMTTTKKTTTTEETVNKPEETTAVPKDTATTPKVSTSKPRKPTKALKRPTSTKKPNTIPKGRKPKTTAIPPKMTTSTMPRLHPTSSAEAVLTTTSPNQRLNSEIVEVNPNKDAAIAGEKPHMIPRPPVLTPIFIPGTDILVRGSNQDIAINPMLSDETNLCNGKPVDALTTLHNGTLVAFRGHYFWMLSAFNPPSPPRKITEVWGIPSPIDTAFTRCNCEGKTFFFKDSQYWRFTNDIKDPGYPKQIAKGFGGLNGKIVAALSIAKYEDRPESVYFFKRGGSIQQYIYKQEPIKKCPGRRPAISYSVYGETTQVRRRRFERAIGPSQTHTIRIHYSPVRVSYQDKGFLHNEVKMSLQWRGFPNVVTSAIALPNIRKPDGYDYYAFSRNQYYNIDEPSRTARVVTTRFGRSLSNVWYKCP
uniref:Proteoglycan 4 n=1 Tax=Ailuropoda melanoleuca TaxID=9646 RepID=G1MA85_AILME